MDWDLVLQVAGFVTGLLYLWYEYHANAKLWIVSVIMPGISMWIYLRKGIYADFAINIYYLAIAVYGYIRWTFYRGSHGEGKELPITHIPMKVLAGCVAVMLGLWCLMTWGLTTFTDSNIAIYDAFTTSLSIVAMWMLARKYLEQWLAWLAVDAVCVGLYCYKEIYLYSLLYLAYTAIAWLGYVKWKKLM